MSQLVNKVGLVNVDRVFLVDFRIFELQLRIPKVLNDGKISFGYLIDDDADERLFYASIKFFLSFLFGRYEKLFNKFEFSYKNVSLL